MSIKAGPVAAQKRNRGEDVVVPVEQRMLCFLSWIDGCFRRGDGFLDVTSDGVHLGEVPAQDSDLGVVLKRVSLNQDGRFCGAALFV